MRRTWERTRLRIVASGIENEVEAARSFGNFDLLGRFENDTNPFSEKGFLHNEQVKQSSVKWGTLSDQIGFKSDNGQTASIALASGFLWEPQLYIEYAWDTGFLRNGKRGSSVTLIWSKSF